MPPATPKISAEGSEGGAPAFSPEDRSPEWGYHYDDEWISLALDLGQVIVRSSTTEPSALLEELASFDAHPFVLPTEDDLFDYPGLARLRFRAEVPTADRQAVIRALHETPRFEWASGQFTYRDSAILIPRAEIFVVLAPETANETLDALLEDRGDRLTALRSFPALEPTWLLRFAGSPLDTFAAVEELRSIPGVVHAQPNFVRKLDSHGAPNDTQFLTQWDLENTGQYGGTPGSDIRAIEAWDITTGSPDITVAIIDEGVDTLHPDLIAQMDPGYDAVTASPSPLGIPGQAAPADAHGTACAGIVGATGNNGLGVTGVCWNVRLLPIRIGVGSFWTQDDWIVDGITAATNMGADVLSNSWGGGPPSTLEHGAIMHAITMGRGGLGAVVCFSSGNGDIPEVAYPAKYAETIAVGATSPCDERKNSNSCDDEWWWGSQYGPELDLVAPGPKVTTTDNTGLDGYTQNDYVQFSGTSSACPHVAGAAALLLSAKPGLTHAEVRQFLRMSAQDMVGPPSYDLSGPDLHMGYGRLDLLELLVISGATTPPPSAVECSPSSLDARLSWTNGGPYSSIQVSRNGIPIATLPGNSTEYIDPAPGLGLYVYRVQGIGANGPSPRVPCTVIIVGAATDLVWSPVTGAIPGGTPIADALVNLGRLPVLVADLDDAGALDQYESIWVNLGVFPAKHVLTAAQANQLESYLTTAVAGESRALYLEGGDTWFFDPTTSLHPLFEIGSMSDGEAAPAQNLGTIHGVGPAGPCGFGGMILDYIGENAWIDRLEPLGTAQVILENESPAFHVAIAHSTPTYQTIGASWELAGVTSGIDSRQDFVEKILTCWNLPFALDPLPDPVQSFNCAPNQGTSVLSWALGDLYDQIQIQRNGVLAVTLPGTATGFVDSIPIAGINFYEVIGLKGGLASAPMGCLLSQATPQNELRIDDIAISVGTPVDIPVYANHALALEGFTFAVTYDPSFLIVQELTTVGTELEFMNPDIFNPSIDAPSGHCAIFCLIDSLPPTTEVVPPGNDHVILRIRGALGSGTPIGSSTPLGLPESLGSPPVVARFLENGFTEYPPDRVPGSLTVTSNPNLILRTDSQTVTAGTIATTTVSLSTDRELLGYSFGIPYDENQLVPVSTALTGTVGEGAALSVVSIQPDLGVVTTSVVMDLIGPFETVIPIGGDQPALRIDWQVDDGFTESTALPQMIVGGVGDPVVALIFTDLGGASLIPETIAGSLIVNPAPAGAFVRGDVNLDDSVNINDPITILSSLFDGLILPCADATDTNDDGLVDLGDVIYLLQYLFAGTAAPPPPFPNAGVDPTVDTLGC